MDGESNRDDMAGSVWQEVHTAEELYPPWAFGQRPQQAELSVSGAQKVSTPPCFFR